MTNAPLLVVKGLISRDKYHTNAILENEKYICSLKLIRWLFMY
jgi:hypothetical protein